MDREGADVCLNLEQGPYDRDLLPWGVNGYPARRFQWRPCLVPLSYLSKAQAPAPFLLGLCKHRSLPRRVRRLSTTRLVSFLPIAATANATTASCTTVPQPYLAGRKHTCRPCTDQAPDAKNFAAPRYADTLLRPARRRRSRPTPLALLPQPNITNCFAASATAAAAAAPSPVARANHFICTLHPPGAAASVATCSRHGREWRNNSGAAFAGCVVPILAGCVTACCQNCFSNGGIGPCVHSSFARERKLAVPGGKTSIVHMHAQHIKSHPQAHGLEADVCKWKWIICPFCLGLCPQLGYL